MHIVNEGRAPPILNPTTNRKWVVAPAASHPWRAPGTHQSIAGGGGAGGKELVWTLYRLINLSQSNRDKVIISANVGVPSVV